MRTISNSSTIENHISRYLQNKLYHGMPQYELISVVVSELLFCRSNDKILAAVKSYTNSTHYVAAQNLIEISICLIGRKSYMNLKTFKEVDKLLQSTRRAVDYVRKATSKELISELVAEFTPCFNTPISKKELQCRLQVIYDQHGIVKPSGKRFLVSQNTILEYFLVIKPLNRTDKNTLKRHFNTAEDHDFTGKNTFTLYSLKYNS